jgi:hypothetical protein
MAGTPWSMMSKTFSRIRNECPRRLKDLKVTCDEVINVLSEKDKEGEDDENADPYFHYFQQACECKHAKIVEIALDGIHSLIGAFVIAPRVLGFEESCSPTVSLTSSLYLYFSP